MHIQHFNTHLNNLCNGIRSKIIRSLIMVHIIHIMKNHLLILTQLIKHILSRKAPRQPREEKQSINTPIVVRKTEGVKKTWSASVNCDLITSEYIPKNKNKHPNNCKQKIRNMFICNNALLYIVMTTGDYDISLFAHFSAIIQINTNIIKNYTALIKKPKNPTILKTFFTLLHACCK